MKKTYKTITYFFVTAILIRAAFFLCNYHLLAQPPTATDSFGYFERAKNLTLYQTYTFPEKDHEVAFWTPGYPFFMFFIFKIFGVKITALLIVQIIIGSFNLTLLYLLIQENISITQHKYLKIFLLSFPDFILYDFQILTQCLFNAILFTTIYILHTKKWKTYIYAILSGLTLGYAILIKSVATFIIPLLLFYLLRYEKNDIKQGIIIIFIAICSVLPWSIRNYTLLGTFVWVHTNTQWNFYLGNHQQSVGSYGGKTSYLYDHTFLEGYNELEREKICQKRAWAFIKKHPIKTIKNNVLKLSRTFSPRGAWALYQTGKSSTGTDFSSYQSVPNPIFLQTYSLPFLFLVQLFGILGIIHAIRYVERYYWILMPYLAFLATFFVFVTGTNYVYLALPYLVYLACIGFINYKKNISMIIIVGLFLLVNWIFQYYLYTY